MLIICEYFLHISLLFMLFCKVKIERAIKGNSDSVTKLMNLYDPVDLWFLVTLSLNTESRSLIHSYASFSVELYHLFSYKWDQNSPTDILVLATKGTE